MFAAEGLWYMVIPALAFAAAGLIALVTGRRVWLGVTAVLLVLWIAMLLFFRDPVRMLPEREWIVSPVDGTVVEVDTSGERTRVAIFLDLTNVHAVRSPVTGEVTGREDVRGKFHIASDPRAGEENQHTLLDISSAYGPLELKVMAGAVVRRVIVHPQPGDSVHAGQRIGFVRFGSRAELLLPPAVVVTVEEGDEVFGGVTLFADTLALEALRADSLRLDDRPEVRSAP